MNKKMEDITMVVRKNKCNYLHVQKIMFTFVMPTVLSTSWLVTLRDDKLKWFLKSVASLPGKKSSKHTTCRRFLAYVLPKFFGVSIEKVRDKRVRKLTYDKLRLYSDGSDVLTIVYLLSQVEMEILLTRILPKLKEPLAGFTTTPSSDEVIVGVYRHETRTWPKLLATVVAASTLAVGSVQLYKFYKQHTRKIDPNFASQKVEFIRTISAAPPNLKKVVFFPHAENAYYFFPSDPRELWREGKYQEVVREVAESIDELDVKFSNLLMSLIKSLMHFKNSTPVIFTIMIDLMNELLIESQPDIVSVWETGGWKMPGFSFLLSKFMPDKILTNFTAESITGKDKTSFVKFVEDLKKFQSIIEGSEIIQIDKVTCVFDIYNFLKRSTRYRKLLGSYIVQYLVAVISQPVLGGGSFVKNSKADQDKRQAFQRLLSYIFKVLGEWTKKEKQILEKVIYPTYVLFEVFLNRVFLIGCSVYPLPNKTNKASRCYEQSNLPGSFSMKCYVSNTAVSIWDKILENNPGAQKDMYLKALHYFCSWYTQILPGPGSVMKVVENIQTTLGDVATFITHMGKLTSGDQDNGLALLVVIIKILAPDKKVAVPFVWTLRNYGNTEMREDIISAIQEMQAKFNNSKCMNSREFIHEVGEHMVFFENQILGTGAPKEEWVRPRSEFQIKTNYPGWINCYLRVQESNNTIIVQTGEDENQQGASLFTMVEVPNRDHKMWGIGSVKYPKLILTLEPGSSDGNVLFRDCHENKIPDQEIVQVRLSSGKLIEQTLLPGEEFELVANEGEKVGFYTGFGASCGKPLRGNVGNTYMTSSKPYTKFISKRKELVSDNNITYLKASVKNEEVVNNNTAHLKASARNKEIANNNTTGFRNITDHKASVNNKEVANTNTTEIPPAEIMNRAFWVKTDHKRLQNCFLWAKDLGNEIITVTSVADVPPEHKSRHESNPFLFFPVTVPGHDHLWCIENVNYPNRILLLNPDDADGEIYLGEIDEIRNPPNNVVRVKPATEKSMTQESIQGEGFELVDNSGNNVGFYTGYFISCGNPLRRNVGNMSSRFKFVWENVAELPNER